MVDSKEEVALRLAWISYIFYKLKLTISRWPAKSTDYDVWIKRMYQYKVSLNEKSNAS